MLTRKNGRVRSDFAPQEHGKPSRDGQLRLYAGSHHAKVLEALEPIHQPLDGGQRISDQIDAQIGYHHGLVPEAQLYQQPCRAEPHVRRSVPVAFAAKAQQLNALLPSEQQQQHPLDPQIVLLDCIDARSRDHIAVDIPPSADIEIDLERGLHSRSRIAKNARTRRASGNLPGSDGQRGDGEEYQLEPLCKCRTNTSIVVT